MDCDTTVSMTMGHDDQAWAWIGTVMQGKPGHSVELMTVKGEAPIDKFCCGVCAGQEAWARLITAMQENLK